MAGVNFSYGEMYNFYRRFGEVTNDVFVRWYSADYPAMKYERNNGHPGEMKPFIQRSMQVRRVPTEDPLSDTEGGTFVVYRAPTDRVTGAPQSPDKCQRMFVVTPKECLNELYGTFWVGNHYTFLSNRGLEENKRLQLHRTFYTPNDEDLGKADTIMSPLPLRFVLPNAGFESMLVPALARRAPYLHELMHRPFAEQRPFSTLNVPRVQHRYMMQGGASFDSMWYSLPIRSMTVVGVRVGRTFDVSVFVRDRACNMANRILMIKCLERDVETEIAKGFSDMNRDNFGFDELPDDYYDM